MNCFFNWNVLSDELKHYTVVYTGWFDEVCYGFHFIITCLDVYCLMLLYEQVAPDTVLAENKINSSLKYLKATVFYNHDYLFIYYHYYFLEKERSLFFCLFRRVSARQPEVSGACAVWSSGERPDTQTCLWVTLQLFIFAINLYKVFHCWWFNAVWHRVVSLLESTCLCSCNVNVKTRKQAQYGETRAQQKQPTLFLLTTSHMLIFLEAKNQLFRIVWVVIVLKYSISFFLARLLSFYDVSCRLIALTLKICRSLPRDIMRAKLVAADRNETYPFITVIWILFRWFLLNVDDESAKYFFFFPISFQLAKDLLHPTPDEEKRRHKKKRLVQCPNSYFMDVKCPGTLSNKIIQ